MNTATDTRRLCALVLLVIGTLWASNARALGRAETAGGPLRAAYAQVATEIDGDVARTVVTQVFVNDLPGPVEASYGITLPADATLTGFAEWRDGLRTEAVAQAAEQAAAAYDAAADKGERAALVAKEKDGLRLKLMAIPGNGTRRVELRYAQTLTALGGAHTYILPADGPGVPVTALDVAVSVRSDRPILKLDVPNQADARVAGGAQPRSRVVRLNRMGGGLEHDLVVRWQTPAEPLDLAGRLRHGTDGEPVFEVRFAFNADDFAAERAPRDVVVVVDASMSMAGAPLRAARAGAAAIIDGLNGDDRFDFIAVSDKARSLVGGLVAARPDARELAHEAIGALNARGRTDLQAALDLAAARLAGSPNGLLVLLTDGQPTVDEAGETDFGFQPDLAAFAGSRVLVGLFNYPGNATALRAAFADITVHSVPDGPAAEASVAELAQRAVAPVIEDFGLEVEGKPYQVAGALPGRLPLGDAVRLVGRTDGPVEVVAHGVLHGVPFERSLRLDLEAAPAKATYANPGELLKAMGTVPEARGDDGGLTLEWARLYAADLEAAWGRADGAEAEALAGAVRHVGTRYGVVTKFTSYVLTDSLSPDHIKPGDPEIRVHAPRHALRVFAVLPWGEVVDCAWSEDEGLWLGRFLVPRGVADGLYRARLFEVGQAGTLARGALSFLVDSKPPPMVLLRVDDEPLTDEGLVMLRAVPLEPRLGPAGKDSIDRDPVVLRSVVVQLGEVQVQLEQVGDAEIWEGALPTDVEPGRHVIRLVATDYARNTATAELAIDVQPFVECLR